MTRGNIKLGILALSLFLFFSCANQNIPKTIYPNISKIEDAFAIKSLSHEASNDPSDSTAVNESLPNSPSNPIRMRNSHEIVLKKSALNTEFLLQAAIIPQGSTETGGGSASRIVQFKKDKNKLVLVQSSDGFSPDNSLPANLLLTSFPIKSEDNQNIYFDFAEGFKYLYIDDEWHSSERNRGDPSSMGNAAYISESYISNAKFVNNNLTIFQVAQIVTSNEVQVFEVRYFLQPYKENPNFTPSVSKSFEDYGYFATKPRLSEGVGNKYYYVTKWDILKAPIIFYLSANTPQEFKPAIRDGILYWNTVFGKEVLKVLELKDTSITAPYPGYNIIQWVDYKMAGFAYADAQFNPRTGEILQAQVFLTSTFVKLRPFQILASIKDPHKNEKTFTHIGNIELDRTNGCLFPHDAMFDSMLSDLSVTQELQQDTLKRIINAYLASTVTHEVGHTLGLRHNFAGSAYANITEPERLKIWKDYVLSQKLPQSNIVTTSSIMDYNTLSNDVLAVESISSLSGDGTRIWQASLAHDKLAIQSEYPVEDRTSEKPPFCTDSAVRPVSLYYDCNTFDSGKSENILWDTLFNKVDLRKRFYLRFISLIAGIKNSPSSASNYPVLDMNPDPESLILDLMGGEELAKAFNILSRNSRNVSVYKSMKSHLLQNERNNEILKLLNNELSNSSNEKDYGFKIIDELSTLGLDFKWAKEQMDSMNAFLSDNEGKSITNEWGTVNFSDYDIESIKFLFYRFVKVTLIVANKVEKDIWTAKEPFRDFYDIKKLEEKAAKLLSKKITDQASLIEHYDTLLKNHPDVNLIDDFGLFFNLNAAESLFKSKKTPDFFLAARIEAKGEIIALYTRFFGNVDPTKAGDKDILAMPTNKRAWFREFQKVMGLF